jgi:hypothetical protein
MSRRKDRYERRKLSRLKRKERLRQYDDWENVISFKSLFYSALKASKGVRWKASVQRYLLGILFKTTITRRNLQQGKDIRQGFIEFDICERGKIRHIRSVHFNERVVQKSICLNAMYPIMTNSLICDNTASQKGKGTYFAEKRLVKHLQWYYRHYGHKGYVLATDFKNYFENIPHDLLKQKFREKFSDKNIIKLADDFVSAFGERGLGLGSETSQINAIAHIDSIDHIIKEVERVKCYGRYNDDSYIISSNKKFLEGLLTRLENLYAQYGVILNKRKTKIKTLKGFTFLKTRYFLAPSGKIVKKPCRESIVRERRKLKRQARLYQKGYMSLSDINTSFVSWLGSMKHRHARRTVWSAKKLYKILFEKEI